MKKARAHDLKTHEFLRTYYASEMSEELRHAHQYQCPEPRCSCTVHWRKAHSINENTETRHPVFVKNPSSDHISGCFYDFNRIAEERRDYTYLKDDQFHVRLNFPVGTSRSDVYPMRGYLTTQQTQAAKNTKTIKPFNSLTDLVKFVETNLGELDREDLPDLVLHYQGRTALFQDKFIGNRDYDRLHAISLLRREKSDAPSAFTVVKPTHEIEPNSKGKRRFACEAQEVKINNRKHFIQPILVSTNDDYVVESALSYASQKEKILGVIARPFLSPNSFRRNESQIYLNIGRSAQFTELPEKYWRMPIIPMKAQLDMFDTPSKPLT
jgi:hypothetical protein